MRNRGLRIQSNSSSGLRGESADRFTSLSQTNDYSFDVQTSSSSLNNNNYRHHQSSSNHVRFQGDDISNSYNNNKGLRNRNNTSTNSVSFDPINNISYNPLNASSYTDNLNSDNKHRNINHELLDSSRNTQRIRQNPNKQKGRGKLTKLLLLRRHVDIGFGFSIRGGVEHGTGIFVSNLNKYSDAFAQGLQVGDQILRVNNTSCDGILHEEAVQVNLVLSCFQVMFFQVFV